MKTGKKSTIQTKRNSFPMNRKPRANSPTTEEKSVFLSQMRNNSFPILSLKFCLPKRSVTERNKNRNKQKKQRLKLGSLVGIKKRTLTREIVMKKRLEMKTVGLSGDETSFERKESNLLKAQKVLIWDSPLTQLIII